MRTFFIFLFLCGLAHAETVVVDENNPNVTYGIPTQEELAERAIAQQALDQKAALQEQKDALQKQIDAIAQQIVNAIADDNDALVTQLKAQRNALKLQLQGLQ